MKRKGLMIGAVVLLPGLFLGLIFTMLLLLAPAKPAVASCCLLLLWMAKKERSTVQSYVMR